ncbi:MAG: DUF695 domain-containing protein [Blastocatellia bacterium]
MSEEPKPKDATEWVILKAEKDEQVSICRLRKTRPPAEFWTLVSIEWTYSDPDHNGFPGPDLQQDMNRFEDSIVDLMEKEGVSWLALVITGLGLKEWSFYASDFKRFIREFNELLRGEPVVPIKIVHSQDPECQYWGKYRKHAS